MEERLGGFELVREGLGRVVGELAFVRYEKSDPCRCSIVRSDLLTDLVVVKDCVQWCPRAEEKVCGAEIVILLTESKRLFTRLELSPS